MNLLKRTVTKTALVIITSRSDLSDRIGQETEFIKAWTQSPEYDDKVKDVKMIAQQVLTDAISRVGYFS